MKNRDNLLAMLGVVLFWAVVLSILETTIISCGQRIIYGNSYIVVNSGGLLLMAYFNVVFGFLRFLKISK